jgi:hypothetical protein
MRLNPPDHSFGNAPSIRAPRSVFNRDSTYKTAFDIGYLIPFYWDEYYPGDTFNVDVTAFARLSTPIFPIMDGMWMDFHFFSIGNRLLWDNWRKMMGEQVDPGDSIDYTVPILEGANAADCDSALATQTAKAQALMDYMGVPDGVIPDSTDISALPFRAYSQIYAHWYRDQNLIDTPDCALITDDGPDDMDAAAEQHYLQKRGKRFDYFTSCLPWPNKADAIYGSTGVTLPLGTSAPIISDGNPVYFTDGASRTAGLSIVGASNTLDWSNSAAGATTDAEIKDGASGMVADLSTATASTINALREAFQIQKLLERDAMAGTRYPDVILNHFGVNFPDLTWRAEYLGGGSVPVNVNPIAANAIGDADHPNVGDLGAVGTAAATNIGFNKTFLEHGIVMGIVSVRASLHYQQGLRREFSRSSRYDYYWPSLAHLGMQPVYNKEIYCDNSANDDLVFGYQNRYDELRYRQSQITNIFRSAAATSLEAWHLADDYSSLPTLGQTFIEVNTDLDRCVQVTTEPHFIFDSLIKCRCARPMPVNATPGMIDHF